MTSSRRSTCVLVLLAAAACNDPNTLPVTYQYTTTPVAAWAGSAMTVVSAGLAAHTDTGFVELGAFHLPVHWVNDTTVTVTLPDTISGAFAPMLQLGNWTQALDSVTVYGYADVASYPFQSDWDTYAWPRNGPHAMIVTSGDDDTLHFVDLDTHQFTSLGGEMTHGGAGNALWGPGPSYNGSFYLQGDLPPQHDYAAWALLPLPSQVAGSLVWSIGLADGTQNVMRLGPTTWFASGKAGSYIITAPDSNTTSVDWNSGQSVAGIGGNMNGLYLSPRGDRATVSPVNSPGGVPVFAMPSGSVAFRVTGFQVNVRDVDFSPDGSLLAMAGDSGGLYHVALVDATTGTVLHEANLAGGALSVRIDPARSALFVATAVADSSASPVVWHPAVVAFDLSTFRVIGELETPRASPASSCTPTNGCGVGRLAISPTGSMYFYEGVVVTSEHQSWAWRFTLPPAAASSSVVLHPKHSSAAAP
ncbi:MAG TPA: hypothetical protein VGL65_06875 [Gemmatimonadales bacterium]